MTDDSLGICLRCTLYTGPHHSKVLHHASCIYECLWMIVCFKLPASFGRTIALGQVVWKHVMRHNVELDSTWPCHDLKVIGWIWNLFGFYLFNQPFHLQGTFYWGEQIIPREMFGSHENFNLFTNLVKNHELKKIGKAHFTGENNKIFHPKCLEAMRILTVSCSRVGNHRLGNNSKSLVLESVDDWQINPKVMSFKV